MTLVAQRDWPGTTDTSYFLGFGNPRISEAEVLTSQPFTMLELRHQSGAEHDPDAVYTPSKQDIYWKIGITLRDVDVARARLQAGGVEVSEPSQFLDIGYLCHLADPDGYIIELLQHTFGQRDQPLPPQPEHQRDSSPTLGQVTLRIKDPDVSLSFYQELLGMRLLSRQIVEPYGFTLYFLGCTNEAPPQSDIDAVANREWLWQRPYTTLELQHVWKTGSDETSTNDQDSALGFEGISFVVKDLSALREALIRNETPTEAPILFDAGFQAYTMAVLGPDGERVRVIEGEQ